MAARQDELQLQFTVSQASQERPNLTDYDSHHSDADTTCGLA